MCRKGFSVSNTNNGVLSKAQRNPKGLVPRMSRDEDGSIQSNGRESIERWKQHYCEHSNDDEGAGNKVWNNEENKNVMDRGNPSAPIMKQDKDVFQQL